MLLSSTTKDKSRFVELSVTNLNFLSLKLFGPQEKKKEIKSLRIARPPCSCPGSNFKQKSRRTPLFKFSKLLTKDMVSEGGPFKISEK